MQDIMAEIDNFATLQLATKPNDSTLDPFRTLDHPSPFLTSGKPPTASWYYGMTWSTGFFLWKAVKNRQFFFYTIHEGDCILDLVCAGSGVLSKEYGKCDFGVDVFKTLCFAFELEDK